MVKYLSSGLKPSDLPRMNRANEEEQMPAPTPKQQTQARYLALGLVCLVVLWLVFGPSSPPSKEEEQEGKKAKEHSIYEADHDIACAISERALDLSPVLNPESFVKVPKGTQVVVAEGHGLSHLYWKLSTGADSFYIYDDVFKRSFTKIKTVTNGGDNEAK